MIEVLAGLLVTPMVGLPLATALTATTAILAGIAAILALAGLFARSSALLTAAVIVGLVEELVAVMQAGAPTDLLSPVLLGIVMYLLLEVSAFAKALHGVRVDASVFSAKLGLLGVDLGAVGAVWVEPRDVGGRHGSPGVDAGSPASPGYRCHGPDARSARHADPFQAWIDVIMPAASPIVPHPRSTYQPHGRLEKRNQPNFQRC